MPVSVREFYRASACGDGQLFSRRWINDGQPPRAIVQIAHGMCEHSGRYGAFAEKLAGAGYAVYANDHIGHGLSANGHPGTFCLKKGGFDFLREDMRSLFDIADLEFPGLPHALFGHSMGSIAAAIYPARDRNLRALVLMGTPAPNPMAGMGILIGRAQTALRGYTAPSKFLTKAADVNMSRGRPTPTFASNGFHATSAASAPLSRTRCAPRISRPRLCRDAARAQGIFRQKMAGQPSRHPHPRPLGHRGPGEWVRLGGRRVPPAADGGRASECAIKTLPGDRHELLNEADHETVEKDILDFLGANL